MAKDVSVWVDPAMEELEIALLDVRSTAMLRARGTPLTCPVFQRPATPERALSGRPGYGYCSEACLEAGAAEAVTSVSGETRPVGEVVPGPDGRGGISLLIEVVPDRDACARPGPPAPECAKPVDARPAGGIGVPSG